MKDPTPVPPDKLGGRLPLLDPAELDAEQQSHYDYLQRTKINWAAGNGFQAQLADGRMIGPFNGFLYSPHLGQGFNDWVDAETAHTSLSPTVRQIIILTVGAAWNCPYELYAHIAVAHTTSLREDQIAAVATGHEPAGLSTQETGAHTFTRTLVTDHQVDDELYESTVDLFGAKALVDMVHLIGMYLATSALLNAFSVPAP